jgi:hypothetical protein
MTYSWGLLIMINNLLSRLNKVKSTGRNSWLACCPAHDDRSPSLSIKEEADGHILLHCFAGCSAIDVVGAIGVDIGDLFPEQVHHKAPVKKKFYATDILEAIKYESQIVLLAAFELKKNKPLDETDLQRLQLAYERIREAVDYE